MARGKKTGGRDFVPGDPRAGRPPGSKHLSDEDRAIRRLTQVQVSTLINSFMQKSDTELEAVVLDPLAISLHKIIARIIQVAMKSGDQSRLTFLMERGLGKPSDENQAATPMDPLRALEHALKVSQTALIRIEQKQNAGDTLTLDEYRSMRELTKNIQDITTQINEERAKLNLSSLSDEELRAKAREWIDAPNNKASN